MIATAEKALKDAGDKVDSKVKGEVEEKIKNLKEISAKEDVKKEDIEKATKELSDTLTQIGQAMYQKQEPASGKDSEGEKGKKKDKEGEEKKSDKKDDAKVEEGEVVE